MKSILLTYIQASSQLRDFNVCHSLATLNAPDQLLGGGNFL